MFTDCYVFEIYPLSRYNDRLETRKVKLKTSQSKIHKRKHKGKKNDSMRHVGNVVKKYIYKVLEGDETGAEAMQAAEEIIAKNVLKLVKRHQTTELKILGTSCRINQRKPSLGLSQANY